ncbi:hypothetical protein AcV5_006679 [Taiwanofungus camphoratus]|nr:hypothetical protein AcV5_006679 [Antrodia cinnamomea]KAI0935424.1 hypothetical protein AcV7_003857 [Antrodia cinnamomea]
MLRDRRICLSQRIRPEVCVSSPPITPFLLSLLEPKDHGRGHRSRSHVRSMLLSSDACTRRLQICSMFYVAIMALSDLRFQPVCVRVRGPSAGSATSAADRQARPAVFPPRFFRCRFLSHASAHQREIFQPQ